ncbi:hypothetical protein VTN49DRAFT_2599 [Thermomyces lanuginosus]|uniref:uncharacterized protein n=1 Tax=Thermomyces lanuginosus TaxID=5541 RepID=UPI003742D34E
MWLSPRYQHTRIDHYIDQLRQAALWHGDMTPVTLKTVWLDNFGWAVLGQTERLHTFRDGEALRRWGAQQGR